MGDRVSANPPPAPPGSPRCGHTDMQGFDVVLECVRPPHADDLHRSDIGQNWRCD